MKKLLCLLLTLALLFSLAACGGSAEPDPNAGLYEGESAKYAGISVSVSDVFEDGFSIELKNGGKAVFRYEGKDYDLKWTLDGTTFHAEGGGAELDGTLSNGVMVLQDVLDSGVEITLVCRAIVSAPKSEPAPQTGAEEQAPETAQTGAEEPTAAQDGLAGLTGTWYGWRVYYECGGFFAQSEGLAYDMVGTINFSGETGVLALWEYDEKPDSCAISAVGHFDKDEAGHDRFLADAGSAFGFLIGPGDLWIVPEASPVASLEKTIAVEGRYTDPENADNWLHYFVILRPWGMDWEDVKTAESDDFLYKDMMPIDYDWYLGMLESGADPLARESAESGGTGADPALIGEWEYAGYTYIFREDGTGAYAAGGAEMTFTYEASGGELSILFTGNTSPMVTTYRIDGGRLIVKDSFGSEVTYTAK